jgi:hypothetical protein
MQKGEKIKAVDSESVPDCGRNNFDGPLGREVLIGLGTGTKLFCSPFLLHSESKADKNPAIPRCRLNHSSIPLGVWGDNGKNRLA